MTNPTDEQLKEKLTNLSSHCRDTPSGIFFSAWAGAVTARLCAGEQPISRKGDAGRHLTTGDMAASATCDTFPPVPALPLTLEQISTYEAILRDQANMPGLVQLLADQARLAIPLRARAERLEGDLADWKCRFLHAAKVSDSFESQLTAAQSRIAQDEKTMAELRESVEHHQNHQEV